MSPETLTFLPHSDKIDGLHYLSNYAEKVQKGETRKAIFFSGMEDVAKRLNLSEEQIDIEKEILSNNTDIVISSAIIPDNKNSSYNLLQKT